MRLIIDAGALVGIERGNRVMLTRLKAELVADRTPLTHAGIVGQVWRGGGGRQVPLARALDALQIVSLDEARGRAAGMLLSRSRTSDVIDAALVGLAADDDVIITSDPGDIQRLVNASGRHIDVVAV